MRRDGFGLEEKESNVEGIANNPNKNKKPNKDGNKITINPKLVKEFMDDAIKESRMISSTSRDQLIGRGLLSSAQKVIQRLISKSSASEAFLAADFALVRGMQIDLVTYGCLIRKLVTSGESPIVEAFYVDCIVGKGIEPDCALLNSMVICYCKLGRIDEGKSYFDRLIELKYRPCIGACDAIIRGFCGKNRVLEGNDCLTGKMKTAMRLFLRMLKVGCEPDNYTYNTLIHGFVHLGLFDKAWLLYKKKVNCGLKPNMTVYLLMLGSGIIPDHVLFFTLAKNHPKGDEVHVSLTILQAIATRAYEIELSIIPSYMEHKCADNMMLETECLLEDIARSQSCLADTAFCIYMIALCMGGKLDSAFLCIDKMASPGLLPLFSAYNSLIKAESNFPPIECKDRECDLSR
ncbi:Hypothetical predicted protein [Olea europaea subsp. europaea]|uniref:Pentatricopeptide repeat-containing protein n=1 Tax=Olea europaea subsp. europaea TaxID=158383 RepID=A0A8S0QKN1_OLEEU|nr:Hypothetical predicted protein [Olea europaea subsp. europaea]